MRSCNSYQDIKTPEDYEEEERVEEVFEDLCDYYADEIAEHGMNWMQKASLMNRARKIVKEEFLVDLQFKE